MFCHLYPTRLRTYSNVVRKAFRTMNPPVREKMKPQGRIDTDSVKLVWGLGCAVWIA